MLRGVMLDRGHTWLEAGVTPTGVPTFEAVGWRQSGAPPWPWACDTMTSPQGSFIHMVLALS